MVITKKKGKVLPVVTAVDGLLARAVVDAWDP